MTKPYELSNRTGVPHDDCKEALELTGLDPRFLAEFYLKYGRFPTKEEATFLKALSSSGITHIDRLLGAFDSVYTPTN